MILSAIYAGALLVYELCNSGAPVDLHTAHMKVEMDC